MEEALLYLKDMETNKSVSQKKCPWVRKKRVMATTNNNSRKKKPSWSHEF